MENPPLISPWSRKIQGQALYKRERYGCACLFLKMLIFWLRPVSPLEKGGLRGISIAEH
jgi:hypothetical protein